jgi:hypothetical protein
MNKDKKFVGQPVLSQILSTIPAEVIRSATKKHSGDRYYKRIPVKVHLTSLLYGVLSYCNGLREICEGMLACECLTQISSIRKALLLSGSAFLLKHFEKYKKM